MSRNEQKAAPHYRERPRKLRRLEVRYRLMSGATLGPEQRAITRDISIRGAFLLTANPEAVESRISVELDIPRLGRPLSSQAIVCWVSMADSEGQRGMGIRFVDVSPELDVALKALYMSLV